MGSDLEEEFLSLWRQEARAHGMGPESDPVREYRFCPGRKWRFDFAWPQLKVAVEIDGGIFVAGRHSEALGSHNDRTEGNAAAAQGWFLLRYDPLHLREMLAVDMFEQIVDAMRYGKRAAREAGGGDGSDIR